MHMWGSLYYIILPSWSCVNTAWSRFEKWSYLRPKFPISMSQRLLEKVTFDSSILIHKWILRNLNITSSKFNKWKVQNIPFSPSLPPTHGIFSALHFVYSFIFPTNSTGHWEAPLSNTDNTGKENCKKNLMFYGLPHLNWTVTCKEELRLIELKLAKNSFLFKNQWQKRLFQRSDYLRILWPNNVYTK